MSSVAEQATRSWTSDVDLFGCHHQLLSMVPFYVLMYIDSTETRFRFNAVWTLSGMRAQTRLYNEGVKAAGHGHTLDSLQIWAWGGLIADLQMQRAAVGAANAATLTGYLKQLDGMSMDTKCDHARFCKVDRTYQSEQAHINLSVDRSVVRDPVVTALQQLGAARKYGRAPPTQLCRELQQWLETLLDNSEVTRPC